MKTEKIMRLRQQHGSVLIDAEPHGHGVMFVIQSEEGGQVYWRAAFSLTAETLAVLLEMANEPD